MANNQKVAVVGLGYVGLPLALLAAKKGYDVTGIDADKNKVAKLQNREDPLADTAVAAGLKDTTLKAVSDYEAVAESKIVIICVPTPVRDGHEPDLTILKKATESIAEKMSEGTLIIVESTINPGVCDDVVIPALEKISGLDVNDGFHVSHCPERINPGDPKWSVSNIPRVAGSGSKEGLDMTVNFYESILDAPIKPMASLKEAEAVKVVENSFRDINIAFVNELAMSFTKIGVDVKNVIDGAATKPFAFMPHYPSVGVGGHCIPVDPYYLIEYARDHGFNHEFLSLARKINNGMPAFTVERLIDGLKEAGQEIKDARVAVLGLSYKADVADDRESPSYKLIDALEENGAQVATYDPFMPDKSSAKDLAEALRGKDAVILATNHKEFLAIRPAELKVKVFVDGKNAFTPADFTAHGIIYRGIGR
jgi:nucleotide sugar dehydrogenase